VRNFEVEDTRPPAGCKAGMAAAVSAG